MATGWAKGSVSAVINRPRVKKALKCAQNRRSALVEEKAAQQDVDLREEVLRSLLALMKMDAAIEKARENCPTRHGIDPRVFATILVTSFKAAVELAEILMLKDFPDLTTDELKRYLEGGQHLPEQCRV